MGRFRLPTTAWNLFRRIDWIIDHMATQEDLDALNARVSAATEALNTGVANIRGDIETLKAANPGVDTSALEASVAALEATTVDVGELDAENPA